MARTVNKFNVPFNDFKLDEIIDPEQFDANNEETVKKINEVIDVLNVDKTNVQGDHLGTWRGMTPEAISSESINGARIDVIDTRLATIDTKIATFNSDATATNTRMTRAEGILQNMQKEVANSALYTEASKRVLNGHVFGTDFASTFNMTIKDTNTTLSSALSNGSGLVNVVSSAGFSVGEKVFIFDDVNYDYVTIQSINGNSISTTAVTKAYAVGANVASSMIDSGGYFRGFSKVADSLNSLTGWTTEGATVDSTWSTEGGTSIKITGTNAYYDGANISKTFDLTNISYIKFDFRYNYTTANGDSNRFFTVHVGAEETRPITQAPLNASLGSHTVDVRHLTGVHSLKIRVDNGFNNEVVYVNVDNMRFLYQPPKAEFSINLSNTNDVIAWIEAKSGISFTAKLGTVDMDKKVEGLQTQFNKAQTLGTSVINVVVTATGAIIKKIDKILGGYA